MWRAATPGQRSRPQRQVAERAGSRARTLPGRLAGGAAIVALALAGAACSSGDRGTPTAPDDTAAADTAAAAAPSVATAVPERTSPFADGPASAGPGAPSAAASSDPSSPGGTQTEPAPPSSPISAGTPGQTPLRDRPDADPGAGPAASSDTGPGSEIAAGSGAEPGSGAESGPDAASGPGPEPGADPGSAPEAGQTPPTAGADPTDSTSPTDATSPTAGEPFDLPYPAGTSLAVVGVRYDDVLFVRSGPGPDFGVVETLGPSAEGVVTSGRGWLPAAGGAWAEVSADGVPGWANLRFLALRDGTADITADVTEQRGGPVVAESMVALGRLVVQDGTSADPPPAVVLSSRPVPVADDLHEVGYDVVGLADDSVRAVRLRVVGRAVEGGLSYELVTAESTAYCARGAGPPGGTCV